MRNDDIQKKRDAREVDEEEKSPDSVVVMFEMLNGSITTAMTQLREVENTVTLLKMESLTAISPKITSMETSVETLTSLLSANSKNDNQSANRAKAMERRIVSLEDFVSTVKTNEEEEAQVAKKAAIKWDNLFWIALKAGVTIGVLYLGYWLTKQ